MSKTARRLWHTLDVRIKDLFLRVFLGASAKFLVSISESIKDENSSRQLLERKIMI